ncbi:hypothetical protein ACFL9U_11975 [Thermodesulfobacteriota bacterium]
MKKEFNPRMHSAEHILNQSMHRMFGCGRCFSAHIEKKKSKCDYHYNRDVSGDEIKEIERCVNHVIDADFAVTENYIDRGEAKKHYNLERLPSGTEEKIRIVKIGDYDACPCIGPHVSSTKMIGGFRITSTSFKNGVLRAHSKITSHLIRRCIPPGCVAKARNIQIFLRFRALPDGRLNAKYCEFIYS